MNGDKSPPLPSKAAFSRADLLWAFFAVDETQHPGVAELLGFEADAITDTPQDAAQPPADNKGSHDKPQRDEPRDDTTPPQSAATSSSYYRIVSRQLDDAHPDTDTQDAGMDWLAQASPTILEETETRIPPIHRVVPLYSPLIPWSRLLPLLQRVLGDNISGIQPDMPRLVKQVADREFIRQIPRKQRHSWALNARVLIDINDNNFPYRRDFIHLRERLKDARGDEGLQIQYVHDEPGGYIARYEYGREVIEPWKLPEKGTPILILSDMGMQAGSRIELYGWLVFGQLLKVQGFRPTVLMPVAERTIDKRLLKYFDCIVWDRNSRLKRVKGTYQPEQDKQNHAATLEQLLQYCFAAVRVDGGLLRAVRQLLPSSYDIGHEALLWQHPAVNREGDEWGWQASSKPSYLDDARKQLAKLEPPQQDRLVELIGRYHAQYPDELYFEAMYGLMMLGLPMPEEVRAATEKFMQDMVATYRQNPDNTLLEGWVKRHLVRHDDPAIRQHHRYWLPFMAFVRVHEADRNGTPEKIDMRDGLTPAEQEIILRYVSHARQRQTYVLRQSGEKLQLLPEHTIWQAAQSGEWGINAGVGGANLLTLHLRDTHIFHDHHDAKGKQHLLMLDLVKAKKPFEFPPTGQHEFQLGRERIAVDVKAAQRQQEPWMKRITAGSSGFRAESRSGGLYYWHPPEWQSGEGMLPGFWYPQPTIGLESVPWAGRLKRDVYGLYADAELARGIKQRFRWIEPTTFQMGSPETEAGRSNNETRHQVTLTQGYWLADTACTQALWQGVTGQNPSNFKGANNPVEYVSWDNITQFLQQLNQQQPKLELRLPTEAEWENACRTGISGAFNFEGELSLSMVNYSGAFDGAGFAKEALQQTAIVKSYPPNRWGLYEMHGNVWEWCQDWFDDYPVQPVVDPQGALSGTDRVLRGGSWLYFGRACRSAARYHDQSGMGGGDDGFRLARSFEISSGKLARAGQIPVEAHGGSSRITSKGGLWIPSTENKFNETVREKSISLLNRAKDLFKK